MSEVKQRILIQTFDEAFNIASYKTFIQQLFNNVDMKPGRKSHAILNEFKDQIESFVEVANYTDTEDNKITILAVELKRGLAVHRSRSMQRNYVASFFLKRQEYDGALVAFYTEGEEDWRLSFLRLDYTFTNEGVMETLTPAKRYSYLLGQGEPKHTAKKQLLPLFINDTDNPTLDELEQAFSIEAVTKDFFVKYKEKYIQLKEYLEQNEAFIDEAKRCSFTSEEFAKKLMGQIAFLYFLQKKGWLGVKTVPLQISGQDLKDIYARQTGEGQDILSRVFAKVSGTEVYKRSSDRIKELTDLEADQLAGCFRGTKFEGRWGDGERKFIRHLFTGSQKLDRNFFDEYLTPLFYAALNTQRGESQYFSQFNCKIPFLNGGLFEPIDGYDWGKIKFSIPDEVFSNKTQMNDGTGILDIFDMYNFTMNEDEPLEKEVAVDPEMLGKIFENLLEVKDRKSKGAFYTPREIVHYMCQESIINHLVNETKLNREELSFFIKYGEFIKDEDNKIEANRKKEYQIPINIFENIDKVEDVLVNVKIADPAVGSGAFPLGMLNEIVKARMNITEYLVKKEKENEWEIRLSRTPYLLKKHTMQKSIYAVDIESSAVDITKLRLWLSLIVDEHIDSVRPLPNLDYNIMCGNSLIDEFEGMKLFDDSLLEVNLDNKKQLEIFKSEIAVTKQLNMFASKEDDLLEHLYNLQQKMFNEQNPDEKRKIKKEVERIEWDLIEYKLTQDGNESAISKVQKMKKEKSKPYFLWKLEFSKIFREKGGFDIVIGNPPYGANFNKDEKEKFNCIYIHQDYQLDSYLLFIENGLRLSKNKGVLSYIIPNTWISNITFKKIRKHVFSFKLLNISHYHKKVFNAVVDTQVLIVGKENIPNNKIEINIFDENLSKRILYADQNRWIQENGNSINIFSDSNSNKLIKKIEDGSKAIKEIAKVVVGMKPYQKGKGKPKQTKEDGKNRIFDMTSYTEAFDRKLLRGKDIEKYYNKWDGFRWIKYGDWLAEPRHSANFDSSEKIVLRQTGDSLIATIDREQFICMNNMHVIHSIHSDYQIEYILAIINSKVMNYYYQYLNPEKGEALAEVKKTFVEQLQIKSTEQEIQDSISEIVSRIMLLKKEGSNTTKLQDELDKIFYDIYELTEDEIRIVEEV